MILWFIGQKRAGTKLFETKAAGAGQPQAVEVVQVAFPASRSLIKVATINRPKKGQEGGHQRGGLLFTPGHFDKS